MHDRRSRYLGETTRTQGPGCEGEYPKPNTDERPFPRSRLRAACTFVIDEIGTCSVSTPSLYLVEVTQKK